MYMHWQKHIFDVTQIIAYFCPRSLDKKEEKRLSSEAQDFYCKRRWFLILYFFPYNLLLMTKIHQAIIIAILIALSTCQTVNLSAIFTP